MDRGLIIFIVAAFVTGALVPLQLSFNAQLGGTTKNPFSAGLIIFLTGTVALSIILLFVNPQLPTLGELAAAPKTVWFGGLIATAYIIAIVIVTPKLGIGLATATILIGQLCMAVALDHFGAFGNTQVQFNLWRASGLMLMIGGVILIKTH